MEEADEKFEEKVRGEEYKVWKKNAPFLYDLVLTHALEWPSLTCEWISDETGRSDSKLLLGTHTNGDVQNHVIIASVTLPSDDVDEVPKDVAVDGTKAGSPPTGSAKIEIKIKINHDGEVNRARAMPQNRFIVATKSPTADVLVFDVSKHSSIPADSRCTPEHRLTGHTKEGYGLSWSPLMAGQLLSGSDDAQICMWDVDAASSTTRKWHGHTDVVEDVMWHATSAHLFGSVGDDRLLCLWDIRDDSAEPVVRVEEAHTADINSLAFNPEHEFLLATASHDSLVKVWDIRSTAEALCTLEGHKKQVSQVQWAPFDGYVLATCGADRRVRIWDLSLVGQDQTAQEAQDAPPELLFIHGGHTNTVSDFGWNSHHKWLVASVADDNIVQIWKMADTIHRTRDIA